MLMPVFTTRCTQCKPRYCYRKSSVGLSVCLSVCLSVTLRYREHIGWTSSKLITRIISVGSRTSEPQHRQSSPRGTPQIRVELGWGRSSQQKTCTISETGQDIDQCSRHLRKWGQRYYIALFSTLLSCCLSTNPQNTWLWMNFNGHFTLNFHYYEQRFQQLGYILIVESTYGNFLLYDVTSRDVRKRTVIRRIFGIREGTVDLS